MKKRLYLYNKRGGFLAKMTFSDLMNAFYVNDSMCNQRVYDNLLKQMKNNRVIPVIGAGLSCWAGYPLWDQLLRNKAKGTPVNGIVEKLLSEYKYELTASKIEEYYNHNTFLDALVEEFSPAKIIEENRPAYQRKLPKLFKGPVVTTNYDVSLERLFGFTLVYTPENEFLKDAFLSSVQMNESILVKLHGTIKDSSHIILSNERYIKTYGIDESCPDTSLPLPRALTSLFNAAPPLFLGCGLNSDRTCAVFNACNSAKGFALLELPKEKEELEQRRSYFDSMKLQVIWYPYGEHESVGVLIDSLFEDLSGKGEDSFTDIKTAIYDDTSGLWKEFFTIIEKRKTQVNAFGILPVLESTLSFEKTFPELFIKPVLRIAGTEASYQDLLDKYKDKNLVILGNAGAGKSTLLKYVSLFESIDAYYFTARDLKDDQRIMECVINLCEADNKTDLLLLIDGVDEVYWNDYEGFKELVGNLLRVKDNVHCWVACRTDFYRRTYSESTVLTSNMAEVMPWEENDQAKHFLDTWSIIFEKKEVSEIVLSWAGKSAAVKEMLCNPFQLTILAYLAGSPENSRSINTVYDLYEQFFKMWFKRETNRTTGGENINESMRVLKKAAWQIYNGYPFKTESIKDTAVIDLLIWQEEPDLNGNRVATMFRHHSLAAFIIAFELLEAMEKGEKELLDDLLDSAIKDDVTNFILRKAETLDAEEINRLRRNLLSYYNTLSTHDNESNRIKEKVIFYMSRFPGDSSEFLLSIVEQKPSDPYIRLSLAYAGSLSDNDELRKYALNFAKSIAENGNDAKVNRGWTVCYFGDSRKNPYEYMDEDNGTWNNAREARLKRFRKENPRLKDIRFILFDVPLFHTFLETRGWNDISKEEYESIKKLSFSTDWFKPEEIEFLEAERNLLLGEYSEHLKRVETIENQSRSQNRSFHKRGR